MGPSDEGVLCPACARHRAAFREGFENEVLRLERSNALRHLLETVRLVQEQHALLSDFARLAARGGVGRDLLGRATLLARETVELCGRLNETPPPIG